MTLLLETHKTATGDRVDASVMSACSTRSRYGGLGRPLSIVLAGVSLLFTVASCSTDTARDAPTAPTSPAAPSPTAPLPPGRDGFALALPPGPVYVGIPAPTPETHPTPLTSWQATVTATGQTRGTIHRVDLRLRDRATGALLGTATQVDRFTYATKTGPVSPLLSTGSQTLDFSDSLGFAGEPAVLETEVVIRDDTQHDWTVSGELEWRPLKPPAIRAPIGLTVRQNDPRSGCAFDPVHGYGLLLEIAWDAVPDIQVDDYTVAVADGRGTELIAPFYAHVQGATTLRFVRCDLHVSPGAERNARVGVLGTTYKYHTMSPWGVAHFDFQSCHDAGTPACH